MNSEGPYSVYGNNSAIFLNDFLTNLRARIWAISVDAFLFANKPDKIENEAYSSTLYKMHDCS